MPLQFKKRKPTSANLNRKVNDNVTRVNNESCKPKESKKKKTEETLPEMDNAKSCSKEEAMKYLRDFDLDSKYGPCMNIQRSERYRRAVRFGLNPPESVTVVLQRFRTQDESIENCVWSQYVI